VSTLKKSQASRPCACAARNSAQVGPDLRGEGSTSWRFRIAHTLDDSIAIPIVASSPWMRR
jgi:hypothetical protein